MATTQLTPARVGLRRILIATDFSRYSNAAIDFGLRFARSYQVPAYIVSVVPCDQFLMAGPEVYVAAKDAAGRDMEELESELRRAHAGIQGEEYHLFVLEGEIASSILQFARDKEIDLIVVGTHGRGGLQKALLGSVAENIFRNSPVPVLTLGPGVCGSAFHDHPREILVPADFTQASRRAISYAAALTMEHKCALTLLHVIDPKSLEHVPDRAAVIEGMRSRLLELLGRDAKTVHPCIAIKVGEVTPTILEMAREGSADLLVMGVRPSGGVLDRLRIPHAYAIVRDSPCPVLTLRESIAHFDLN